MSSLRENMELQMSILKDAGSGGHRDKGSTSFAAIYATFIPTFTTAVIYLIIFVLIRQTYRNIYVPRTYFSSVPEKDRTPPRSYGSFSWIKDLLFFDDKFVLQHQSLDGYLFLRFFRTMILLSLVGCCITWPVLFLINATGGGNAQQLDRISFSNITGKDRLYAHAFVAWLFLGFVMLLIARERMFVISLRQANLLSASNAARLSSRVVVFLSVPNEALRDDGLKTFGTEAKRSWVVSNLNKLEGLVQDRNQKATALENAEVELSRNAVKKSKHSRENHADERGDGSLADQSRPMHKTPPVIGKEQDTIQELRAALPEAGTMVQQLRDSQKNSRKDLTTAMFVEFKDQAAAQRAYQEVHHHSPLRLWPRFIGVQPKEAIWHNLTIHPSTRIFNGYLAVAFITATIILWSIPIGFISAISNVNYLTGQFKFLRFLNNLPDPILGFLQGFVPPYVVSEVVSYVPKFFRHVAKFAGAPTIPEAEKNTQQWYFAFQLIQVFLVTTFSSGAAAVALQLYHDPTKAPSLLAENLPKASNFYLSYFILQGTASAAKNILNYSDLFEYLFYAKFIDKTPRQQYTRYTRMKGISWGSVYPKFANMAVIAIAYSCIAPLVLGFSTIGLFLYYLSYRHNLIYVIQTKVDTKGAAYSLALQHILTGVYISELCLIGLFSARKATGPTILMVTLLIGSIIYHVTFNRLVGPMENYLPIDLLTTEEETPLLSAEEGRSTPDQSDSPSQPESRVQKYGAGKLHLPTHIVDPLARFLEPNVFNPPQTLKSWFHDSNQEDEIPTYTDDELKNAYINPAMTSKTPKLWLARDDLGISKTEIEENEKFGITATDEGATVNKHGKVVWDMEEFGTMPIFKMPARY